MNLLKKIYHYRPVARIFHTTVSCLQDALADCDSVLDLGCGPSSPVQYCIHLKRTVGVEVFTDYLELAKINKTHTEYLSANIFDLNFPENSFDAVVLIEVIEHMEKTDANRALALSEKWAKKKVILTTPNGFFKMDDAVDGNKFQKHPVRLDN